jgi:hypothetical protein
MNSATIRRRFKLGLKLFVVGMITVFTVLDAIFGLTCPRHGERPSDTVLGRDSTHFVSFSERSARLRFLSDVILQLQSTYFQAQLARESERMQARLSFVAAFALLLVALLRQNKSNTRLSVVLIAIVLFVGFYFFDIHTVDLGDRQNYTRSLLDTTILALPRIPQSDSALYYIDYGLVNARYDSMAQHPLKRKVQSFFRPDISEIVFYYLPLSVLLGLYWWFEIVPGTQRSATRKKRRASAA